VTAVLIVAGLVASGCKSEGRKPKPPPSPTPQTGGAATASAPSDKSSKELALEGFLSETKLEGKATLIEFGLVGCELSEKGLDAMIALQKAAAIPGLEFLRVEANPDAPAVASYFREKAPPFPVHMDAQSPLAKSLGATAYPTFMLVDKFGHVRYRGRYPADDVVTWGKALAAESQDPGSSVPLFGAKTIDVASLLATCHPVLGGEPKPLGQFKGEGGLVLLFVDTKCPFSAIALAEMPGVAKTLAQQKVAAVIVNNDDSQEKVTSFYAKKPPGAPVLYDVGSATREQWNVQSVPIAVYLTPSGKIAYQGEAVWAKLATAIESSQGLAGGTIKFSTTGTGFG